MKNPYLFVTSTMFSRVNGPASFAINLFESNLKNKIHFLTEDVSKFDNITKVKPKLSLFFSPLGMIMKSIDYFKYVKKRENQIIIWNFSILSWYCQFRCPKKNHIVFVNDPYSLENKLNLNYKSIRLFIFSKFEKYAIRKSDLVITNSQVIKEMIVNRYDVDEHKIRVLLKGIKFNSSKIKTNFHINYKEVIKVSFVKSDYVSGGLERLCCALMSLNKLNFAIDVIGIEYLPEKFYNYNNIEIFLHGRLSKEELNSIIIKTDFFCIPNLIEAFGQANIEAMSLQIPTIILPSPYQKKIHSISYCYMPNDFSMDSLSSTIKKLIYHEDNLRKNMAIEARKIVLAKYSFEKCLYNFNNILKEFE